MSKINEFKTKGWRVVAYQTARSVKSGKWIETAPNAIHKAKQQYDRGQVNMCQLRDPSDKCIYLITKKRTTIGMYRKPYFFVQTKLHPSRKSIIDQRIKERGFSA